jgi:pimeloyl-ACP methyl ester carboxylesterase
MSTPICRREPADDDYQRPMSTATVLRATLVLEVLGGAALAAWLLPDSSPGWLAPAIGVALPLVTTAGSVATQLVVDACLDPRSPRGTWRNGLRVWLGETAASIVAFCWRQPFRAGFPEPPIVDDPGIPAVLLIHGYACNRAVWLPLLDSGLLAGCNVATVNLEPIFASIDDYAATVGEAIRRLQSSSGAPRVTLVCHSMGGLVARAYLRAHGSAAVARLITISTPHAGTIFARFGRGRNARQMVRGSSWLIALGAAATPEVLALQTHFASRDDNLIHPRAGLVLAGAAAAHWFDGIGHLAMLNDPRVWQRLAEEIKR